MQTAQQGSGKTPASMFRLPTELRKQIDDYRANLRPIPQPGTIIVRAVAEFLKREAGK